MTRLSVNLNKVALIRNARGGNNPDLQKVALDCVRFGAEGITVHPRPDERHIRRSDVPILREALEVELNIEGYPSESFLQMIERVKPGQCTLVPDPPGVLTSSEGWNAVKHQDFLTDVVSRIKAAGVRTSLFMECKSDWIEAAKQCGADRIEFYTGPYAAQYSEDKEAAVSPYVVAAKITDSLGLGLNAGHDLDLENLAFFRQRIPNLLEVSIGHALVCDALYGGLEKTIQSYLDCLK